MIDDLKIMNAIIESAVLDIGDRGFLQSWITLDYGGTGQGFGGFVLCPYIGSDMNPDWTKFSGNYAGVWLTRIMQIAAVGEWGKLKGRTIRAKANHGRVEAIGHIVKDDWFNPSEVFKAMEEANVHA